VKELDPQVLKERIAKNSELMKKQVSQHDYIKLLEEIYNRLARKRIALSFLTDEEARKRNVVLSGKKQKVKKPQPPCREQSHAAKCVNAF